MIRLIADEHLSHRFIEACIRLQPDFPIAHVSEWEDGILRKSKDPALLASLRSHRITLVTFDRRTMASHAAQLIKDGASHSGIIIFRKSIVQFDFGKQARSIVEFWREAADWNWIDRIEYIPRPV